MTDLSMFNLDGSNGGPESMDEYIEAMHEDDNPFTGEPEDIPTFEEYAERNPDCPILNSPLRNHSDDLVQYELFTLGKIICPEWIMEEVEIAAAESGADRELDYESWEGCLPFPAYYTDPVPF